MMSRECVEEGLELIILVNSKGLLGKVIKRSITEFCKNRR